MSCHSLIAVAVLAVAAPAEAATDAENPAIAPSPPAASAPPPAEAADLTEAPASHNAIYIVMGAGTPVGFMGFEGVRRLGSAFEIGVGLGRGFAALASQKDPTITRDLQWAIMPRMRVGAGRHVFTLGVGASGGNYGGGGESFCDGPCPDRDYPTSYVVWANVEIGSEHWWRSGFALRTFLGYAVGCSATSCTTASGGDLAFPYLGLGLGYAF